MPQLKLNNVRLFYEEEGTGKETIVFGHSMLFNLRMFDQQVAFFKKNYRCVRFDFRGHGKSESTINGYDLDTLAEDTFHLIKALNCEACHFVGFSMGGMVGMRLAIKYSEIIKSLILIDTSSEAEPSKGTLRNHLMLFVAKYIGLKPLSGKVLSLFFGAKFLKDPTRNSDRKNWKNHFENNNRKGIVKAVRGVLSRKSITHQLDQITHPTLILVGEQDQLTDISKAQILNDHIKNSSLEVVSGAGHMSPVEEAQIVNSHINHHLKKLLK